MRARPARGEEGRPVRPGWLLCALAAAACGGEGEAPSAPASPGPGAAPPAAPAEAAPGAAAQAPAWTPPAGVRVIVPALGGEAHPRVIRHTRTGIELLIVRAGTFELGSTDADPGHASDEGPARAVEMSAFYVARTETTLAEWTRGGGESGRGAGPDHPVVDATWGEVDAWCRANGLALPTEAQWEYAASGPENRVFPWGDADEPFRANALGTLGADRWDDTAPAASFPRGASWCSAYDLAGNAAEWCRDAWAPSYDGLPAGPDPVREEGEGRRVVRGGSFSCRPPYCLRTAYRDGIEPELKGGNLGFRAVLALER